jgi:Spy/CpxP family protein refolding chaperone
MKKTQLLIAIGAAALTLMLGGTALAQPQDGGGGGFGGFQNMDPQQQQDMIQQFQNMDPQQIPGAIQERVNGSLREQMGVTNDDEWSLIQERINAVSKARAAVMADGGGMMGMGGMRGGFGGGRGGGMSSRLSPEAQALQQAIDDGAPAAQIKDLLAKLQAVRRAKQAALVQAQDDLRAVLTIRQEAVAQLIGLLS